jgi:hypothetical protein
MMIANEEIDYGEMVEHLWVTDHDKCQEMYNLFKDEQTDGVVHLNLITKHFPDVSKFIVREYKKCNGKIPYDFGYIYLLNAVGTSYYKIGKSVHPDKRLKQISPKMPYECELISVIPTFFKTMAEAEYHAHFEKNRVNGEWFEIEEKSFLDIPSEVIQLNYLFDFSNRLANSFQGTFIQNICDYSFNPLSSGMTSLSRLESAFSWVKRGIKRGEIN